MATEAFLELREIPGFKSRAFGFWKLVDDLARESNSFILGKERPHAPVDIYVWLEHLLGSDGMLGQALQASVACCSCFNYALEIASMYLGADPINRIGFFTDMQYNMQYSGGGRFTVRSSPPRSSSEAMSWPRKTYIQPMHGESGDTWYKTDFLLMITTKGVAPCGSRCYARWETLFFALFFI